MHSWGGVGRAGGWVGWLVGCSRGKTSVLILYHYSEYVSCEVEGLRVDLVVFANCVIHRPLVFADVFILSIYVWLLVWMLPG